jgi:putative FmdB family regulatory protein
MPTYEYECESCGIRFERRQRITADPLKLCPECSGNVHRVIQPVGVIFKGSGWYCKDNSAASSSVASAPKAEKESSSETKPAAESKPAKPASEDKS